MGHLLSYRVGSLQKPHLPFARIAELGIQGLEMVWNEETTVDAVKVALDPVGLRVASIHAPAPMDNADLPALLGRHAKYAAELGAAYLFVSVQAGEMAKENAYALLRKVGDAVGEHEVYLAMETHPDLCQNADNMLETMAGIDHPWVGVNYDMANIYFYNKGVDTVEEAKKAAKHVRGVHLKDTMGGFEDWNFPVFGEGVVDFAAVAQVFDDIGYQGAYAMELEGGIFDSNQPDDLADKVSRCIAHLRQVGVVE